MEGSPLDRLWDRSRTSLRFRLKRLQSDPWAPLLKSRQGITKAILRKLKLA